MKMSELKPGQRFYAPNITWDTVWTCINPCFIKNVLPKECKGVYLDKDHHIFFSVIDEYVVVIK